MFDDNPMKSIEHLQKIEACFRRLAKEPKELTMHLSGTRHFILNFTECLFLGFLEPATSYANLLGWIRTKPPTALLTSAINDFDTWRIQPTVQLQSVPAKLSEIHLQELGIQKQVHLNPSKYGSYTIHKLRRMAHEQKQRRNITDPAKAGTASY